MSQRWALPDLQPTVPDRVCVWNAFGDYSCQRVTAAKDVEGAYEAAALETPRTGLTTMGAFPVSAYAGAGAGAPSAPRGAAVADVKAGVEGFCGCGK